MLPSAAVILVNPVQPKNARSPMEVTEAGIVISVSPVQWQNAFSLMEVTLKIFPPYSTFSGIEKAPFWFMNLISAVFDSADVTL